MVLLRGDEEVASWALLCTTDRPDLGLVDQVARLQLTARRMGCSVWLRHACPDLVLLLELVGLRDVVGPAPRSRGRSGPGRLQVVGEVEGGDEAGVEEAVMPDDPVD